MKFKKQFLIILLLFFIFLIITVNTYANSVFSGLSENFFRLHIIANSDSNEDQELKLKVRDAVLEYMNSLTSNINNKSEVIEIVQEHMEDFKSIAKKVVSENGYKYDINIEIGNFYFPTKFYGNISLPAGYYDALKIEIGESAGQNWWCSLFPPLCFVDISSGIIDDESEEFLKENLSEEEFNIISDNSSDIKLKFKIIELLNGKNVL